MTVIREEGEGRASNYQLASDHQDFTVTTHTHTETTAAAKYFPIHILGNLRK